MLICAFYWLLPVAVSDVKSDALSVGQKKHLMMGNGWNCDYDGHFGNDDKDDKTCQKQTSMINFAWILTFIGTITC